MGYWFFHASHGLLIACSTTTVDMLRVSRVLPHLFYPSVAMAMSSTCIQSCTVQHWLLYSVSMVSPSTLCFSWAHIGRVEPGCECEPVHSNIHARPLDYTATVQATNTVLKCELCTIAYILYKVEGQSFKMVATCIHTLHTFPCNEVIRISRK